MTETDKTKDVLEQLLAQLYLEQAKQASSSGPSHLMAADGQLLGKITDNSLDRDSILNEFGPYGSRYSPTSIFNEYSQYGSPLGLYSLRNPYTSSPPKLVINGNQIGVVTKNSLLPNRIDADSFINALRTDVRGLLRGQLPESEPTLRRKTRQSYIEGADGQFLGKLNPNKYDAESIFSKYGQHGSKYSPISVFNKYSPYGSQFSALSMNNSRTTTPPKIYVDGKFVAHLTANERLKPRVSPDRLLDWAAEHVQKYG
jgi:hypothetical protein